MTEIATEDDLWKLFSKKPKDHRKKGDGFILWETLSQVLNAKSFGDGTHALTLNCEDRFYRVVGSVNLNEGLRTQAIVRQRDLRKVGRALNSNAGETMVGYLGTAEIQDRVAPGKDGGTAQRKSGVQKTAVGNRARRPSTPKKRDSLDKIATSYFALLTTEPFEWRGKLYEPRDVTVSPLILRGYTCPAGCGGCCNRFSLDYIAPDTVPEGHPLTKGVVEFDGREIEVWSDMQKDHNDHHCRNLNKDNGRCEIHGFQPFSCDFELLRSIQYKDKSRPNMLIQKLYGRGHDMLRVDGERGALCKMTPVTDETIADVDRRLARLGTWMKHFGLNPVRVEKIRAALPEIAQTGEAFLITESEEQARLEGDA
jgi:hypothetical protein